MKPTEIPQHQDDPQWIIIWPVDELAPIVILASIGILIEQAFVFTVVGFAIARFYRVAKSSHHNGFVLHWLYAHGLLISGSKTLKNTYNRRFIPR